MAPYQDRGIMYATAVDTLYLGVVDSALKGQGDAEDNRESLRAWLDADVIKAGLGLGVTSLSAGPRVRISPGTTA